MDVQQILTIISTVGFPIAMCVALFYMIWKINDQHKEEMTKITESLNNNTVALTKLTERLHVEVGGEKIVTKNDNVQTIGR